MRAVFHSFVLPASALVLLNWLGAVGLRAADDFQFFEQRIRPVRTEEVQGSKFKVQSLPLDGTNHWAFQRLRAWPVPRVNDLGGMGSSVDAFLLAKLAEQGLGYAPPADKRELIRRATFDLLGLPPTPEDVEAFENDTSADAFPRLVERLLASPRYGERWGRWWLDLARYADSNGQDENKVMANAWRYRDWVIRAFNADQPFDQFITEQLAGDLLPTNGLPEAAVFDRWIATGFLVLGPKMLAEQDKPKLVMDLVDEQIGTVSRAFLGLTIACARCHDHKFDPIAQRDYYALAGIFKSTRTMENLDFVSKFNERPIAMPDERARFAAHAKAVAAKQAELDERVKQANRELNDPPAKPKDARARYPAATRDVLARLERERDVLKSNAPPMAMALAVSEDRPVELPIHVRGSHLNLAKDPVPRGFIPVVTRSDAPPIPAKSSGRLELALWLVQPENPLPARVIVNRLWQAHFGEGLVRTPDNFGLRGEMPTHPELLDWLAREFIRGGWSVKQMHRLLMNSVAYQQSSIAAPDTRGPARAATVDPDNRLLSRFPRQRLEAEMIRDALLAVSGRLDLAAGGTLIGWPNNEYVPKDEGFTRSRRRSIYLPVVRDRVYDVFSIFDFANPSVGTAKRTPTVVSHQALFFLNSPLVKDCARALAESLLATSTADNVARVREAYRRILNRPPRDAELVRAEEFLAASESSGNTEHDARARRLAAWSALCQTLLAANEFVY